MSNIVKNVFKQAKGYLDDKKRLKKLISKASDKSLKLKDKDKRNELKEDVSSSLLLLKDWSSREYTAIPTKSILSVIAAMIYFVIPTDIIPDFILGTGFLDDAAIISFMFATIKDDLDKYKLFRFNKSEKTNSLEKSLLGFESLADDVDRNDRYLLETLLFYYSKYEFSKESLNAFICKKKVDFHIREYSAFKRKESQDHIATFITAYTVFNNKGSEHMIKDIESLISLFFGDEKQEEMRDILSIYASITTKLISGETDKNEIFHNHNFETIKFEKENSFELGSGRFLKKDEKEVLNGNYELIDILMQICYILHNSNSFLEVKATIKEHKELSSQTQSLSLFLGAIYYGNIIEKRKTDMDKLLGLNTL